MKNICAALVSIILLMSLTLIFSACGDGNKMLCEPGEYKCGGMEGTFVLYCDSNGKRWETLRDCADDDQTCKEGQCISEEIDGDIENSEAEEEIENGDRPCIEDVDCSDGYICKDKICTEAQTVRYDLGGEDSDLIFRNDTGSFDLYDADGRIVIKQGFAAIKLNDSGDEGLLVSSRDDLERETTYTETHDHIGVVKRLEIKMAATNSTPAFIWTINYYPDEQGYTFKLRIENDGSEKALLAKAIPLRTDASDGGLFLGEDPARHRILENGSYIMLDTIVEIRPGDVPQDEFMASATPGDYEGNSASSWNHAVYDLDSGLTWIAGSLSFNSASTIVDLSYNATDVLLSPDGRPGFGLFGFEMAYLPKPKPIEPGKRFDSETVYINLAEKNPFDGLTHYARMIKKENGIVPWLEHDKTRSLPNGWNSWTGSGTTGGFGTDISEELILQCLDIMDEEFQDWGMDYFQIDDGYQLEYGDWEWKSDKFPNGPEYIFDQIHKKGFKTGVWIAPFTPRPESNLSQEHPDWLADKTTEGTLLAKSYDLLDLTNPEVKEWLHQLFNMLKNEWKLDWVKADFIYWALLGENYYDDTQTREEAYRAALNIIKEELGEDTFLLTIGPVGIHYGISNGHRLTQDNAPIWDWEPDVPATAKNQQQGFKPTVRVAARRFFLNNNVWVNHPDLLLFRSNTSNDTWPRVTLNEAQAFASFVGLSGGIVKIGDRLPDMDADAINSVRKLLPAYPRAASPVDLFYREFPEVWNLDVSYTLNGYDEQWNVLGLFNWGLNWDLSTNPYTEIPDSSEDKSFTIDPVSMLGRPEGNEYLAYEFWTEEFLGRFSDKLEVSVPAHSARVIALRSPTGNPQFLGWNRQISMGGTLLTKADWLADENKMDVLADVAVPTVKAPFTYRMYFYIPSGYEFDEIEFVGGVQPLSQNAYMKSSEILAVEFVPSETGYSRFWLKFKDAE